MYGINPQHPTETVLYSPVQRNMVQLDGYKTEMTHRMRDAWELARCNVRKAQKSQKHQHDKKSQDSNFQVGDRVFVFMPVLKLGQYANWQGPSKAPILLLLCTQMEWRWCLSRSQKLLPFVLL